MHAPVHPYPGAHMRMHKHEPRYLDGGVVVDILRMLIFGVVRVVLNRRVNDARDARPQQKGRYCHWPHCLRASKSRVMRDQVMQIPPLFIMRQLHDLTSQKDLAS